MTQQRLMIVPWCNGNTPDFGSGIQGSNPCGTTRQRVSFLGGSLFFYMFKYDVFFRLLFFLISQLFRMIPDLFIGFYSINLILKNAKIFIEVFFVFKKLLFLPKLK